MSRLVALAGLLLSGCYHYTFQQRPTPAGTSVVVYSRSVPTYLNGFVGDGTVDTRRYCADPVKTELHVGAVDVVLSIATLLIYTPHTLTVTCPASGQASATSSTTRR
jgi:hypothetical protein